MNAKQKIHNALLTKWLTLFDEQAASGLTVKDWCAANNISIHKYNYWKHAAKEAYVDSILPDIVSIPVTSPSPAIHSELSTDDHSACPVSCISPDSLNSCNSSDHCPISISTKDFRVEVFPSASDETILRILKAVRHA